MTGFPGPVGLAVEDLAVLDHTKREHVHQRIAGVAFLEHAFAADGGDAEAVAVVRDTGNDTFENPGITRARFRDAQAARTEAHPEPQWVARPL